MKYIISFLLLFTGVSTCFGATYPLDESVVFTRDQRCQIFYQTSEKIDGWYMTAEPETCPKGVVDGLATVTLYNAENTIQKKMTGYFSQGYFTDDLWVQEPLLQRSSNEKGVQSLTFLLTSPVPEITLIAQMKSVQKKSGYTPFEVCNPFRVLAVSQDMSLYNSFDRRQPILEFAKNQAAKLCPDAGKIAFYASTINQPNIDDVAFYAEILPSEELIEIKRLPSDAVLKKIPVPVSIRKEGGEPVMAVTPIVAISPDLHEDERDDAATSSVPAFLMAPEPILQPVPVVIPHVEIATEPVTEWGVKKTPGGSTVSTALNILTAARIAGHPVVGAAIVHVNRVYGDTFSTDLPLSLNGRGQGISPGWGIVTGHFVSGKVDAVSWYPCAYESCADEARGAL